MRTRTATVTVATLLAGAILCAGAGSASAASPKAKKAFTGKTYRAAVGGGVGLPDLWPNFEYEFEQVFGKIDSLALRGSLWFPTVLNRPAGWTMYGLGLGASTRWYPFRQPLGLAGGPWRGMYFGGALELMMVSWSYKSRYRDPYSGFQYDQSLSGTTVVFFPAAEVGWKFVFAEGRWVVYPWARLGLLAGGSGYGGITPGLGVNIGYLLR